MQPGLVVVALDEGEEFWFSVADVAPGRGGWTLEFEGGEEALGDGIIPAIALPDSCSGSAWASRSSRRKLIAANSDPRSVWKMRPGGGVAPRQRAAQRLAREVGIE